jgi:hypothetical protein
MLPRARLLMRRPKTKGPPVPAWPPRAVLLALCMAIIAELCFARNPRCGGHASAPAAFTGPSRAPPQLPPGAARFARGGRAARVTDVRRAGESCRQQLQPALGIHPLTSPQHASDGELLLAGALMNLTEAGGWRTAVDPRQVPSRGVPEVWAALGLDQGTAREVRRRQGGALGAVTAVMLVRWNHLFVVRWVAFVLIC